MPTPDPFGYPDPITAEMLPKWAEHSDADVARDLADTEQEIAALHRVQEAERSLAQSHPNPNERHMNQYRADGRDGQLAHREAFCAFLRRLQAARSSAALKWGHRPWCHARWGERCASAALPGDGDAHCCGYGAEHPGDCVCACGARQAGPLGPSIRRGDRGDR